MHSQRKPNRLAAETSPYLLQHRFNPVDWFPWGNEAFQKARDENKLVLVSIGYSACHWCHVMEHNCFENEHIASIMNQYFVCIKVDREERPDVDQVYMEAVQLMNGQGGWPLNCFTLPDGRPIYGGTYFPPQAWEQVLHSLNEVYNNDPDKVHEYAERLTSGIQQSEKSLLQQQDSAPEINLPEIVNRWKTGFDNVYGGPQKSPKFPLPCNYIFLLRHGHYYNDAEVLAHVQLTLNRMYKGGIYDHLGGGFARYSVDEKWHVPHFEKMLYDNAQLVSLYTEGFARWKDATYETVVKETIEFVNRELRHREGYFYAALDADTEGEEGKFYVWTTAELREVLTEYEYEVFSRYFGIDGESRWENNVHVLQICRNAQDIAAETGQTTEQVMQLILSSRQKLFNARASRTKPGLDTKVLTSWNALMISALCRAGLSLSDSGYIQQAVSAFEALSKLNRVNNSWIHCRLAGERFVPAFAEDIALLAACLLDLYDVTLEEEYLVQAKDQVKLALQKFYRPETGNFAFTAVDGEALIARKAEIFDNVIPASNSVFANVLLKLSVYFDEPEFRQVHTQLAAGMRAWVSAGPAAAGNWLQYYLAASLGREVAVSGERAHDVLRQIRKEYFPLVTWAAASGTSSKLQLLENRLINEGTRIYICRNNTCNLPVETVDEALNELRAV